MNYRQVGDLIVPVSTNKLPISGTKATSGATQLLAAPGVRKQIIIGDYRDAEAIFFRDK